MCTRELLLKVALESVNVVRGGRVVLRDITATFEGPGLYQVIGPNGSGKTTLLLTILGVLKPVKGKVIVETGAYTNAPRMSYMPQTHSLPRDAPITVYEFVENYYILSRSKFRLRDVVGRERVEKVLELVGIPKSLWYEKLSRLSGGMAQRAVLARALVLDAPIVLLDEPFANIDPEGKVELAEVLGSMSKSKLLIITSHDPILLLEHTKKVMVLGYGNYAFGEPSEVLNTGVLKEFYKKCAVEIERHVHIIDWH
jgi:zinc/manganese transport system ATP-binding protein